MITLITGAPGSGKTLYCVDKILRGQVGKTVAIEQDDGTKKQVERRIFTNINGLLLDHELVDGAWLECLHDNRQIGSLVVFDEVQRVWPNRVANSKKPRAVEYLETHRHDGLDIVLLTQNPQLLDPAVRALVGRHLHMRRVGGMRAAVVYEWDVCSNQLRYKAAFTKTPYRYSRDAFKLYKSARVHTKQKRRLPAALWIGLAGLCAAVIAWPMVFKSVTRDRMADLETLAPAAVVEPAVDADTDGPGFLILEDMPGWEDTGPAFAGAKPYTAADLAESLVPRVPGMAHTAPRYDPITTVAVAPLPAACIEMAQRCKCYSQRATPLDVSDAQCRDIARNGIFLDFVPDEVLPAAAVPVESVPAVETLPVALAD